MEFSKNVAGIVDELDLEKSYDKSIIKYRFLDGNIFLRTKKRSHKKIL